LNVFSTDPTGLIANGTGFVDALFELLMFDYGRLSNLSLFFAVKRGLYIMIEQPISSAPHPNWLNQFNFD